MPTLYSLSLYRRIKGFGSPVVRAIPSKGMTGHFDPASEGLIQPDMAAVRECLPHYYRRAFDRTNGWWYPSDNNGPAYVALYDTRGRNLNTIYATPYQYQPEPQEE